MAANRLRWVSPWEITTGTEGLISSQRPFPTTTKRCIGTTAEAVFPMSVIAPGWPRQQFLFCPGELLSSIMIMMACSICSSPTATFTRRLTSKTGAPPGRSALSYSGIWTVPNSRKCHPRPVVAWRTWFPHAEQRSAISSMTATSTWS